MSAAMPQASTESAKEAAHRLSASALRDGYEPAALHEYRDADGTVIYWRIRCKRDGGEKWIRPMHLSDGIFKIGEPKPTPKGKVLYHLPELFAANPAAPVFIVEGESCCDALHKLGVIATTSGGCTSAEGADWEPLRGRKCIVWADNDLAGAKYVTDVVAKLRGIATDIRLIDTSVVKSLPKGGDVVDWIESHPSATADDVLALPTKTPPYTPQKTTATVQPLPVKAPALAAAPRILDDFRVAIRGCGVVGELATAATVYLIITSRLLNKPVSGIVKGLSGSGKSFTTEQTVRFFPPEATIIMTGMSERALIYSKESYEHKTLILYEASALREGAEDNQTAYFVRSLLSEGRIEYPVTIPDGAGGFTTKTIIKRGPTGLITTTCKTKVHSENETRLLSLNTNDTRDQTLAIFQALANESEHDVDLHEWHQLQSWLQSDAAEKRVTIPYAGRLADLVPPVAVRLRRDFGALLALIKTHAILHQQTRERDEQGRIIAGIDDYSQVRELLAPIIAQGVGATVHTTVRETVEAVGALATDHGAMALAVAERLKLDKSTISRRLRVAADGGYIRNIEDKRGKPGRWVKGDPMPDEVDLLPQPHNLEPAETRAATDGCTVAVPNKGVYREAENVDRRASAAAYLATSQGGKMPSKVPKVPEDALPVNSRS